MSTFLYFAYGSNMSLRRLAARTPSAKRLGQAFVRSHRLVFDKKSIDGSGKADCERTGIDADILHGGLFAVDDADLGALDAAEGAGKGYERVTIEARAAHGIERVVTYLASRKVDGLLPYEWYLVHLLIGAREFGLADDHIDHIARTPWLQDPQRERAGRELEIYGDDEVKATMGHLRRSQPYK